MKWVLRAAVCMAALLFIFNASALSFAAQETANRFLAKAFEVGKTIPNMYNRAQALTRIADDYTRAGQYEQAFTVIEAIDEPYHQTLALVGTCNQAWKNGHRDQAEQMRRKALETADTIERPKWRATAFVAVAESYAKTDRMAQANQVLAKANEIVEDIDDDQWKANLFTEMGETYLEYGKREEGLKLFGLAFEYAKTLEDAYDTNMAEGEDRISVMDRIAEEFMDAGEYARAQEVREAIAEKYTKTAEKNRGIRIKLAARKYEDAVKTAEAMENPHSKAHALTEISLHAYAAGRKEFALKTMNRAYEVGRSIEEPFVQAKALYPVARAYARGRFYKKAHQVVDAITEKPIRELALSRLSGLYAVAGKQVEAKKTAEGIEDIYYRSVALDNIAAAYVRAGNKPMAAETAAKALDTARNIDNAYRKGEVYKRVSRRYAEMGQYDQALAIAETIEDDFHKATAQYWISCLAGAEGKYEQAGSVAEGINSPYYRASAFTLLAEKHL